MRTRERERERERARESESERIREGERLVSCRNASYCIHSNNYYSNKYNNMMQASNGSDSDTHTRQRRAEQQHESRE
jgi:hypothetical protein